MGASGEEEAVMNLELLPTGYLEGPFQPTLLAKLTTVHCGPQTNFLVLAV